MKPSGAATGVLAYFIGEAPGATEDEQGRQFVGASGELIRERIPAKFEKHIRWNNTIRCHPPKNRDPAPLELACCRAQQVADIEVSKPQVIVSFGRIPLGWLLGEGGRKMEDWRGRRMPVRVGTHACWYYPLTHPSFLLRARNDRKKGDAYMATFERDLAAIFADIEAGLPEPLDIGPDEAMDGITTLKIYGAAGLRIIQEQLTAFRDVDHSIDLETDRLRPYAPDRRVLSVALGTFEQTFAFPWQHPEAKWTKDESLEIGRLLRWYLVGTGTKWAHFAKFEQEWFHALFGPDVLYQTNWGDTASQAHALDERAGKGLDDLTLLHFGFDVKALSQVDRGNLANEPLSSVLPYNGLDAKWCHALSVVQANALEAAGLQQVYKDLNAANASLVQIQAKGLVRNRAAIIQMDADLPKQVTAIDAKITANKDAADFLRKSGKFNPASPQDVAAFFRDFVGIKHPNWRAKKEGKYPVDEEALSQFHHPVAKMILERRTVVKNHSTYIKPLMDGGKHVHADGLIHPSYSQLVTVTGRLACEDPNAQNFPRRKHKEIRRAIGVAPGCRGCSADYGQLEARIVAHMANDSVLIAEIKDRQDIHGYWTDHVGGQFVPKAIKANRKAVRDSFKQYWTFALFFGNQLDAVAHDLSQEFEQDISAKRLAPYVEEFWDRYKATLAWQETIMAKYWETGYVENLMGQQRRGPMARNEIINHPIQGTAGRLVIDAQNRICRMSWERDLPMLVPILNVHDDLSGYFPEENLEDYIELYAREMVCTPYDLSVPLSVEISLWEGNWCDKKELTTFYTEDFQ